MLAKFAGSISWLSLDAGLITAARGARTFAQSFISIIIALYLVELGFTLVEIGVLLTVGVAGVSFFAFVVGLISEKVGRRRLLIIFSLLAAAAGLAMYFVEAFIPLMIIAFLGSLSTGGGGGGESPAQPLEVAILPDTGPAERRTDIFAIYSIVARTGTFLGALAAGLPVVFQESLGLSVMSSFKVMFLVFAVCQVAGAVLYGFISSGVETSATRQQWQNPLKLPSRRRIFTLTALFSVDTFTTSMVMQSLMAYWFYTKFGLTLESLAFVFSISHLLTASSLWIAAKLSNRIGLLNTMVFTHIPSSFFLLAAAFAPSATLAIVFWQCRAFLSQMDVPTKDSYTMAVINPEERVAMGSIHMVGRSAAGSIGPTVTTAIWNVTAAWVPLVGSAFLKIGYDLSLYFMFRNVRPPEEEERLQKQRAARSYAPQQRS